MEDRSGVANLFRAYFASESRFGIELEHKITGRGGWSSSTNWLGWCSELVTRLVCVGMCLVVTRRVGWGPVVGSDLYGARVFQQDCKWS
jgi:hypothetical protein